MRPIFLPWWMILLAVAVAQEPVTNRKLFFGGDNSVGINNTAYFTWLHDKGTFYNRAVFVPVVSAPRTGAAIHWHIAQNRVYLAVAARAKGWVGFGLAEAGGMEGADIVYYTASTNKLVDAYILDVVQQNLPPQVDKCQNWKLQSSTKSGGFVIFEAFRDLDTGDTQDRRIIYDGIPGNVPAPRIIAAWGDSNQISYHGPTNRVRTSIRFYGQPNEKTTFRQRMKANAEGSFLIQAANYTIKQQDTEYKHFCFSRQALVALGAPANKPIHVIGWEPIVSKASTPFVHHFVVYGSSDARDNIPNTGNLCQNSAIYEVGYVWGPGENPFALPDNVGASYFGSTGFNSLQLEIHYNNPNQVANIVDNSAVRFYFTTKLRTNNLFVYQFGDPIVQLRGLSVGGNVKNRFYQHTFGCPSSCTSFSLQQPVTVVREYLHMHKTGVRAHNFQIRNGVVIRSGYIDFWKFMQQGSQGVMQQPFQVHPGDSFETRCYYEPSSTTVFGLSSQNEMCIAFLFFYLPRSSPAPLFDICALNVGVDACQENYTKQALTLTSQLGRVFGNAPKNCTA